MKIPKQISVKTALIIIVTSILITSGIIYVFAATPSSTFYISSGVYPGAPSYTVWKEGTNYFAKNAYGQVKYVDNNASEIIPNAVASATSGISWKVTIKCVGSFSIDSDIDLSAYNYIILDLTSAYFTASSGTHFFILGNYSDIIGGKLNGNSVIAVGIYLPHTHNNTIRNVEIYGTKKYGIEAVGESYNLQFISNNIHDLTGNPDSHGIVVDASSGDGSNGNISNIKIMGNTIANVKGNCIGLVGGPTDYGIWRAIVTCNNLGPTINTTYGLDGVQLYTSVFNSIISNNIIVNPNRLGIKVDGSSYNVIEGNVIYSTSSGTHSFYGIEIMQRYGLISDQNLVSGNTINLPFAYVAISISGNSTYDCKHNKITNNFVNGTNYIGDKGAINVNYGSYSIISDNIIFKPRSHGIRVNASAEVTISNNQIFQSGWYAGVAGDSIKVVSNNAIIDSNKILDIAIGGTTGESNGIFVNGTSNWIASNIIHDFNSKSDYLIVVDGGTVGAVNVIAFNDLRFAGSSGAFSGSGSYNVTMNIGYP